MKPKPLPPRKYLCEAFDYDPETGALTWRERPASHFKSALSARRVNTRWGGKRAGRSFITSKTGKRYRRVRLNGFQLLEHRVIWKIMTGDDVGEIDHKNRVSTDNRWVNLRLVSRGQNNKNMRERPV